MLAAAAKAGVLPLNVRRMRLATQISHADTRAALRKAGIDPSKLRCNSAVFWFPNLWRYAKAVTSRLATLLGARRAPKPKKHDSAKVVLGYLVRTIYQELAPQNVGVTRLRGMSYRDSTGAERPLLVFRSGVIFNALSDKSCSRSLLSIGGVRHVINLYAGTFPLADLIDAERQLASKLGATHYDARGKPQWRPMIKRAKGYKKHRELAMKRVAAIINNQILRPGGSGPKGNIHVHCGGGMHRTGMVFGILQRCVNGASMKQVEATYKRHTAYSKDRQTGYEPLNLRFIREFDCNLLRRSQATAKKRSPSKAAPKR